MMETNNLIQRYRNDRRKLLEFLLSCRLIKEIRTPSGPSFNLSNINLDFISADYVLQCVQSDGVLDVSLAAKKYHDERRHPKTMQLHRGDVYFLVTDPESAGCHPQRVPPPIMKNHSNNNGSCPSDLTDCSLYGDDYRVNSKTAGTAGSFTINQSDLPSIGIPALKTGLLKDYWTMIYVNLPMKYSLLAWSALGLRFAWLRVKRKRRVLDFWLG